MDVKKETNLIEEALEERGVRIIKEILKGSLLVVHEDERRDRRYIDPKKELNLTNAPISWLYVTQIQSMISQKTRREALEGLESAISSLTGAIDGHRRNRSSSSQRTDENPFLAVCREFGKELSLALSDVSSKIEEEESELDIVKSIKTVFELTFSFYYKEKGCTPSTQKALQRLRHIHTQPYSEVPVTFHSLPAASLIDMPHTTIDMQPYVQANTQYGKVQNVAAQDGLIRIFTSHVAPMTPVVARRSSMYVRGTNPGDLNIMPEAYAYVAEDGRCVIPSGFCLNASYTPESTNQAITETRGHDTERRLTYVGFRYPDGTSLSYLAINYVRLVYERNPDDRRPFMRSGTVAFAFLNVFLPSALYQEIKQRAKETFLLHHPNTQFVDHHETPTADGRMVKIEVLVKSERAVRIQDKGKQRDYPVLQALFRCGHDICGQSLMHLRFTSTKRGLQRIQLRLILFGITVTRTPGNYNDAIFDLFRCPSGPVQSPLPVQNS